MKIEHSITTLVVMACCAASSHAFAVTRFEDNGSNQVNANNPAMHRTGTVAAIVPGQSITIDGITYLFSVSLAKIYNEEGRLITNVPLAIGSSVSFLTKIEGTKQRITELRVAPK